MASTVVQRVRAFYLPGFRPGRAPGKDMLRLWFSGGHAVDTEIKEKFADDVESAAAGRYEELSATPGGALVNIILLDQFPRNIYRGSPKQFETDPKALALAKRVVEAGWDRDMDAVERMFVYLPYEHSERIEDQRESVRLFTELAESAPEEQREFAGMLLQFANKHLDPIERWGRFPHRNEMLGRDSNGEELAYLEAGGGFGAKK